MTLLKLGSILKPNLQTPVSLTTSRQFRLIT